MGRPGDRGELFGIRQEDCAEYGCLLELTIQLGVIMIGKQAVGNATELIIPYVDFFFPLALSVPLTRLCGC